MKKSLRVANAEAARILLITANDMIATAFDKLKEAYPKEFSENLRPSDVNPSSLTCFAVEMLSREGEL
jgi:hypothetical protein